LQHGSFLAGPADQRTRSAKQFFAER